MVNSSWDEGAQEIVVKHYVNLGIAVAAERGLLVPNVKNAGELSLPELARGLQALAETARAGKATPADLAGGTITITNVGVFGVDAGTPILTPGEAAILAFGQVKDAPWVVDGQLAVRRCAPCRCPSTIASSTDSWARPCCPTWARCSKTRSGCWPGPEPGGPSGPLAGGLAVGSGS
jgi:pyruvate/2-oxoglutarate dehydrogenase complex dihydrolipoamide acyltransferase (E2) component